MSLYLKPNFWWKYLLEYILFFEKFHARFHVYIVILLMEWRNILNPTFNWTMHFSTNKIFNENFFITFIDLKFYKLYLFIYTKIFTRALLFIVRYRRLHTFNFDVSLQSPRSKVFSYILHYFHSFVVYWLRIMYAYVEIFRSIEDPGRLCKNKDGNVKFSGELLTV